MNLTRDPSKQLLKSLRTNARPAQVGGWAALTALDMMRKRSARRPSREKIISKRLEPGKSYVIRMPAEPGDALEKDTSYRLAKAGSVGTAVVAAAGELLTSVLGDSEESKPMVAEVTPGPAEEEAPAKPSRRERRREKRLAKLDRGTVDDEGLSRRRRRRLARTDRLARKRPTRRRIRRARKQQKRARAELTEAEQRAVMSRRRRRKLAKATRLQEAWDDKVARRSTWRRRRKARKAAKEVDQLAQN